MGARAEIHVENYSSVISIEARTMVDMIRHDILPAVSAYADALCQRAYHKGTLGVGCRYEKATAGEVSQLTDALLGTCDKLADALSAEPADAMDAMVYSHETILPLMRSARESADKLETVTAKAYWPFPVYSDLLFSV